MTPSADDPTLTNIFEQLLKDGRADVTELTLREVVSIAERLGWSGSPKIEFDSGQAFLRPPNERLSRARSAVDARQAQKPAQDPADVVSSPDESS
jgi:hypothetical protein